MSLKKLNILLLVLASYSQLVFSMNSEDLIRHKEKPESLLSIIDMVPFFVMDNPYSENRKINQIFLPIISEIINKINEFKRRKKNIVIIENCGFTIHEIMDTVKGYENSHVLRKMADSGAPELINFIKSHNINCQEVQICGFNTDACIFATVLELSKMQTGLHIHVIGPACGSSADSLFETEH